MVINMNFGDGEGVQKKIIMRELEKKMVGKQLNELIMSYDQNCEKCHVYIGFVNE